MSVHHWAAAAAVIFSLGFLDTAAPAAAKGPSAHDEARAIIAAAQAIAPGGIDDLKEVEIGGIKQWIHVRGNNPANPILLVLHGGPGVPMMPESWTFQRPWEDFFTVVQWDQRGAGKTFAAAKRQIDKSITVDRMQADAEELIELLRRTYGKDQIFLMGYSWGSILGVRVAQHHPEWLYAYVGVGQLVDFKRNEAVGYQQTLAEAEAVGNKAAIKELKSIAPYPNSDGSLSLSKVSTERKWDVALGGMMYGKAVDTEFQGMALSPDYTDEDNKAEELGVGSTVAVLLPQLYTLSFDGISTFKCPVVFFAGASDRTTPETLVEEFYNRIQAPAKKFVKFARAAHDVMTDAPGEMLMHLVLDVRPLAQ